MSWSRSHTLPQILVVEDDVLVRMDLADAIRGAGFATHEAGTATEAILLMQAHPRIEVMFVADPMREPDDELALSYYLRNLRTAARLNIGSLPAARIPVRSIRMSKPYLPSELEAILRDIESSDRGGERDAAV